MPLTAFGVVEAAALVKPFLKICTDVMASLADSVATAPTFALFSVPDGLFHQIVNATFALPPIVCPMLQPFAT